jgi:hypothetical protein
MLTNDDPTVGERLAAPILLNIRVYSSMLCRTLITIEPTMKFCNPSIHFGVMRIGSNKPLITLCVCVCGLD